MPNTEYTKTTTSRINTFYSQGSSIALLNKYIVGFYGENVTSAVQILKNKIKNNESIAASTDADKYIKDLLRTSPTLNNKYTGVELLWECSSVSIPKGDVTVEKSTHYFDTVKAVKHPFVTGVQDTAELTITITDTKEMIWYQFFNALKNSFFNPEYFRPVGSSFNKLACYVGIIQGTGNNSKVTTDQDTEGQLLSQLFEFNSIVPSKFGEIKPSHDSAEPLKFSITFVVPNVFQGTYNTVFKGMRNVSGSTYAVDSGKIKSINGYIKDFENSTSDIAEYVKDNKSDFQ